MSEKLTRDELYDKLSKQTILLQSYAEMFDQGNTTSCIMKQHSNSSCHR